MKFLKFTSVILVCASCLHALAQEYSIGWHKVAGGGGTSTNAQYGLSGTIGQPDAGGAMTNNQYSVSGGFWSFVNVVQTPGAPLLVISHVGSQVIVSWDSTVTGFTLQTNAVLVPATWSNYAGSVINNRVTNSPPPGKLFYRLVKAP